MIETNIKWYEPDKGELPNEVMPQGVLFMTKTGLVSDGIFYRGIFGYHVDENGFELGFNPDRIAFWASKPYALTREAEKKYEFSKKVHENE